MIDSALFAAFGLAILGILLGAFLVYSQWQLWTLEDDIHRDLETFVRCYGGQSN